MSSLSVVQQELTRISASSDVDALQRELVECFGSTLSHVLRMAAIVKRLDDLGVQVTIENSMLPYIRLVAHGQLSPNLLASLAGDAGLLEKAMRLPLPIQDKIASNEPIKVMQLDGDHRMVRPLEMTIRERRMVFAGKRLRTDAEQIGWLRDQAEKMNAKALTANSEPAVKVDRKRGGIVANGVFIPVSELAGYVASLSR